jgi:hypothetical protein
LKRVQQQQETLKFGLVISRVQVERLLVTLKRLLDLLGRSRLLPMGQLEDSVNYFQGLYLEMLEIEYPSIFVFMGRLEELLILLVLQILGEEDFLHFV